MDGCHDGASIFCELPKAADYTERRCAIQSTDSDNICAITPVSAATVPNTRTVRLQADARAN